MERLALATALLLLALASSRAAEPASASPPAAASRKRLDLGLYGSPYRPASREQSELRFEAWVDVLGKPKADPNQTMALWWKQFDIGDPAIYGRGYNVRPDAQPNSVNILPLLQKAYEKLKKR